MIFGGVNKKMSEKAVCKHCKSENVYGMSRVVGYYSIIENWNDSKQAELRDRQKGKYMLDESAAMNQEITTPLKKEEPLAAARVSD